MELKYLLDISDESTWQVNTPTVSARRLPFYINECGHYIAGQNYFTQREGLDNYLLIYTRSGMGTLRYADQSYELVSGYAVVINCNRYNEYRTHSQEPWDFKWVHFNGIAADEYNQLLNQDTVCPTFINDQLNFEKSLDELRIHIQINDIQSSLRCSLLLSEILTKIIMNRFDPINNHKFVEHRQKVDKVIQYIQTNYMNKVCLDDLVKIAYLSKFHFLRVFKKHTGLSPYEYLINYRINRAKELLKDTRFSIHEIALLIGFLDTNNFIREFKKSTNATPLNYRKYFSI